MKPALFNRAGSKLINKGMIEPVFVSKLNNFVSKLNNIVVKEEDLEIIIKNYLKDNTIGRIEDPYKDLTDPKIKANPEFVYPLLNEEDLVATPEQIQELKKNTRKFFSYETISNLTNCPISRITYICSILKKEEEYQEFDFYTGGVSAAVAIKLVFTRILKDFDGARYKSKVEKKTFPDSMSLENAAWILSKNKEEFSKDLQLFYDQNLIVKQPDGRVMISSLNSIEKAYLKQP